jgi:hypothetical protein
MLRATGGGIGLFKGIFLTLRCGLVLLHSHVLLHSRILLHSRVFLLSRVGVALIKPAVNILQGAGAGEVHPWIAMIISHRHFSPDFQSPRDGYCRRKAASAEFPPKITLKAAMNGYETVIDDVETSCASCRLGCCL